MSENLHKPDCICVTCEDARNATVTVDRQEWERRVAESEAWRALRACHDDTKWHGKLLPVLLEMRKQIARLDSLTPSNAVEPQPTQ